MLPPSIGWVLKQVEKHILNDHYCNLVLISWGATIVLQLTHHQRLVTPITPHLVVKKPRLQRASCSGVFGTLSRQHARPVLV
jgi:hypothetical protein